jgi:hypothetical protein
VGGIYTHRQWAHQGTKENIFWRCIIEHFGPLLHLFLAILKQGRYVSGNRHCWFCIRLRLVNSTFKKMSVCGFGPVKSISDPNSVTKHSRYRFDQWLPIRSDPDLKTRGVVWNPLLLFSRAKCFFSLSDSAASRENKQEQLLGKVRIKQCCGSRIRCFVTPWIRDPDPGCILSGSRILDPAPVLVKFSYLQNPCYGMFMKLGYA